MEKPVVSKIAIYPVKSLDGISLTKAEVVAGGCLNHDREFALFDVSGKYINGKSNHRIFVLRSRINLDEMTIALKHQEAETWNHFHLLNDKQALENWLSVFFNEPVRMEQNKMGRFMDIPDLAGLTVLSGASLQSVSEWFDKMEAEETRKRFRATIEVDGVSPFWEDKLFSTEGKGIEFTIGDVKVIGLSPRERCSVPTHDTLSGEITHGFPKTFAHERLAHLPEGSRLEAYGHYYYLTVNCHIPPSETGKWIRVGDEIRIRGEKVFYEI